MKKITREDAERLINSSNGAIFTVEFIKADGSLRIMNCRTGVTKYVKGIGMAYDPHEYELVTVYDLQKKDYRMIKLTTLQRVKIHGEIYEVVQ